MKIKHNIRKQEVFPTGKVLLSVAFFLTLMFLPILPGTSEEFKVGYYVAIFMAIITSGFCGLVVWSEYEPEYETVIEHEVE